MPEQYKKHARASIVDQIEQWEKETARLAREGSGRGKRPFVTISRQYGCGGYETAVALVKLLTGEHTWVAYDRSVIDLLMKDLGLSRKLTESLTTAAQGQVASVFQTSFADLPPQAAVHKKLAETIRLLAVNGYVAVVGRGGNVITRDLPGGYHVRLVAPMEWKVERLCRLSGMKPREAEKQILEKDRMRDNFFREFLKFDTADPVNYDMVINNSSFGADEAAAIITGGMKARGLLPR
ncbi:MAG: cytidylate kinase-like family protein [Spirochaetes bacterium]|nr:cytidylate kinase-like family protein [Spirochaetota bacterium]